MARTKRDAPESQDGDVILGAPITITPPDIRTIVFRIIGDAPFVQNRFPEKAREEMRSKHEAGSTGKKGAARKQRDFKAEYEQAFHRGPNNEYGFPASGVRRSLVDVCRLVGFKMTLAKLAIFVRADFFDPRDGTPLVHLRTDPRPFGPELIMPVRNATGVADLRVRPQWGEGWWADLRIRYDAGVFKETDVANLLWRVGQQNGLGEGRPNSPRSCGMGWGTFTVEQERAA